MTVELQTKFLCYYPMLERATLEKTRYRVSIVTMVMVITD